MGLLNKPMWKNAKHSTDNFRYVILKVDPFEVQPHSCNLLDAAGALKTWIRELSLTNWHSENSKRKSDEQNNLFPFFGTFENYLCSQHTRSKNKFNLTFFEAAEQKKKEKNFTVA